jgi:hypothetical protein
MLFLEKKIKENEYEYTCEDVFGKVVMESDVKLDGNILDGVISILLRGKKAETVKGSIKHQKGTLKYIFNPFPTWSDEDEEEICEDTHISTKKPAREYIRIKLLKIPILSWSLRFAEAFKEALRKTK